MIRAYLSALDPTNAQVKQFRSHCGSSATHTNFGLALVRANLDQRAAERSYGITDDQLTPPVSWSAYSLRKIWNETKDEQAPWWAENSKKAYSSGLANLTAALSNWSSSKSGRRAVVANARRDGLHMLSIHLVHEHDVVVVENLNVAGMVRNRRLARTISGLRMAELRRQLDYKTRDAGVRLIVADRWYPSSTTCSACDAVKTKLILTERQFVCDHRGTRLDRDYNAALNLAALADQVASEPSCGRKKNEPTGNPRKTAIGGNGYRHGKAQIMSQGHLREEATP